LSDAARSKPSLPSALSSIALSCHASLGLYIVPLPRFAFLPPHSLHIHSPSHLFSFLLYPGFASLSLFLYCRMIMIFSSFSFRLPKRKATWQSNPSMMVSSSRLALKLTNLGLHQFVVASAPVRWSLGCCRNPLHLWTAESMLIEMGHVQKGRSKSLLALLLPFTLSCSSTTLACRVLLGS
jgi:hypothetical protein